LIGHWHDKLIAARTWRKTTSVIQFSVVIHQTFSTYIAPWPLTTSPNRGSF